MVRGMQVRVRHEMVKKACFCEQRLGLEVVESSTASLAGGSVRNGLFIYPERRRATELVRLVLGLYDYRTVNLHPGCVDHVVGC